MKIAYFSDFFYPEIGGTQQSVMTLGKEMAKRGHEVYFYAPHYAKKDFRLSGVPVKEIDLGKNVKITRLASLPFIGGPTGQSRIVLPGFLQWLKIKKTKPDIIHTQSFWMAGLEALFASKTLNIPIAGTNYMSSAHYKTISNFYFKYVPWFYNQCDYITTPSKWAFTELVSHGLNKPHQAISNPIETEIFTSLNGDNSELKKKYNFSRNTLLFVGRISEDKSLDVIIKALPLIKENIPDVEFVLVGHGSAEDSLKRLAESLGVEKDVKIFSGRKGRQELAEIFRASEIFTIASTSETQGMSMLEAMACGIPTIAARAQSLPEYIDETRGILIEPGDYRALAEKTIALLKNKKERQKLGANGRKYVEKFSISNIARAWEEIYKKVITFISPP